MQQVQRSPYTPTHSRAFLRARRWAYVRDKLVVGLILLFVLLPIVWITLTAFKSERDAYTLKILFEPTLNNFRTIFSAPLEMGPKVLNSVIVSSLTIAIAIPVALMAAYVFSRFVFIGSDLLLVWVLTTQFIPPVVILIPYYNVFRTPFSWIPAGMQQGWLEQLAQTTLLDTRIALVILNLSIVLPYAIWMIKGFIDALPMELEEAAMVDGCNDWRILRYITFPLVIPGVIVSAVFAFIQSWNEFLFALVITNQHAQTLQIGLHSTNGARGVMWEQMSATGVLVMVPIFVMSLFIRKHFVNGLTMGAVK